MKVSQSLPSTNLLFSFLPPDPGASLPGLGAVTPHRQWLVRLWDDTLTLGQGRRGPILPPYADCRAKLIGCTDRHNVDNGNNVNHNFECSNYILKHFRWNESFFCSHLSTPHFCVITFLLLSKVSLNNLIKDDFVTKQTKNWNLD